MTQTIQTHLTPQGKNKRVDTRNFQYSSRGLLSQVASPKGESLAISYANSGRIDSITDNKKAEVKLTYEVGAEKPSEIELKNTGKVLITYDSRGEVENVESPGKRNIATSVIEKFLEMIRFIGPVGENLKI